MNRSMKLLAVLALAAATAAPAFAQQTPHRRDAADTPQQPQWQRQWSNSNANPDFQLGGDR